MGRPGETGLVLPDPMGAATPILPGSSNRAESAITPPALRADRDSQGPSHIAEVGAITFPEPILACEPGARLPTPLTRNCPLAISATRGRGQSDAVRVAGRVRRPGRRRGRGKASRPRRGSSASWRSPAASRTTRGRRTSGPRSGGCATCAGV